MLKEPVSTDTGWLHFLSMDQSKTIAFRQMLLVKADITFVEDEM